MEDPASLVPWPGNPRLNDHAVPKLVESIRTFGFGAPLVCRRSDRRVLAGHTRRKAALELGLREVPVRWVELDDPAAEALALADNKLGELARWDEAALARIVKEAAATDPAGLAATGFAEAEVARLLALAAGEVPPIPAEPKKGGSDGAGGLAQCPGCGHEWDPALEPGA